MIGLAWKVFRRLVPVRVRDRIRNDSRVRLWLNYRYDLQRYAKWSSACKKELSKDNLRAHIMMGYHGIEKGLSLREPRPGFGVQVVDSLIQRLDEYLTRFGADDVVAIAMNCLKRYQEFNQSKGFVNPQLDQRVSQLTAKTQPIQSLSDEGGTRLLTRAEVWSAAKGDYSQFFASRHSVRQFAPEPVEDQIIEKALDLAQLSPSVCNRQAWRTYIFSDPALKTKVLECQNGNRGFGDQASHVIVITCDLSYFVSIGERNQAWIDGGMYAMALIYALHSLGVGSCALNMSNEQEIDQWARQVAKIRDSDAIIMMLALGNLPETFPVAQSPRLTAKETIIYWNNHERQR